MTVDETRASLIDNLDHLGTTRCQNVLPELIRLTDDCWTFHEGYVATGVTDRARGKRAVEKSACEDAEFLKG